MRHNVQQNEVAALEKQLPENSKKRLSELTYDGRLLVISHMPLAYAMAWRMRDCGVSLEDLRQEGCLGLCEAALRFDKSVDATFASYARHWCRKMMLMAIHSHQTAENRPEETFREEDDDEDILRIGQQHRISDALKCLSPAERKVVMLSYGIDCKPLSIREIAAEMGIGKSRASVLHCRALSKLKAVLRKRPLADYLTPWLE